MSRIRRWSDNDRHFGPFTYADDGRTTRWGIILGSGDGDDYPGAFLRFHASRHTLILEIPAIIKPARVWNKWTCPHPDGSEGYWDLYARKYGFSITEGALHFDYGQKTMDSATDKSKCWFIPWTQWRPVRRSLYGLDGEHFWTKPRAGKGGRGNFWALQEARTACPAARFEFLDFDGERIMATTRIEECEWRLGSGWFKWLSLFAKPKVRRSLAITKETGPEKGSWKGGTLGHGIDMLTGELHEGAFRRYCAAHKMKFAGRV